MPKLFIVLTTSSLKFAAGGHLVVQKGLAQLLRDPRTTWVPGDAEMKNPSPVMRDHKEALEHAKRKRRHGEEIHCRNCFTVVVRIQRRTVLSERSNPSIAALKVIAKDMLNSHIHLCVESTAPAGLVHVKRFK
jgi:hypothetical protein